MGWSEAKRKKIWGKKYNPAITMGFFFIIGFLYGGITSLVIGIILLAAGFNLYKKYK